MDCIGKCHKGAISYSHRKSVKTKDVNSEPYDNSRRSFLTATVAVGTAAILHAEEKTVDGGLAVVADKKIPERKTPVVPPGTVSLKHLTDHCTGCQLCVAVLSKRSVETVIRPFHPHAATLILRAWILPPGMHQVLRSVSGRSNN